MQRTAYIGSLPQDIQLPFMWSDDELQVIRNDGVRALIQKSKARCEEVFKELKASSPACTFSKQQFDWALACVLSRSFLGPHPALFFKVASHSTAPKWLHVGKSCIQSHA